MIQGLGGFVGCVRILRVLTGSSEVAMAAVPASLSLPAETWLRVDLEGGMLERSKMGGGAGI